MRVGYARVSTKDQRLDRQVESLRKNGCSKIFTEKITGKNMDRPKLKELLDYIHDEDEVVVTELKRLGRNNDDLTEIMLEIRRKGATLIILDLPSTVGIQDKNIRNLITNLLIEVKKYEAESDREEILERQRQGIELAKKRGAYKGRPVEYSATSKNPQKRFIYLEIVKRLGKKEPIKRIASELGTNRDLIYRIKKKLAEDEKKLGGDTTEGN